MKYLVERSGRGSERVVLIHGSLSVGTEAYSEQLTLSDKYTLEVVTRRGYGSTDPVTSVDIDLDAADIVEIIEGGAHLVGTSMGGMVAMKVAGLRPDLVRSLTVIEPPAFSIAADLFEVRHVINAIRVHWANGLSLTAREFLLGFSAALEMNKPLPDPIPAPLAAAVRNLRTEHVWRLDVPIGVIADAAFPKLVVTGGWSAAFDLVCKRLSDLFETECHTLSGAGHNVQKLGPPFNTLLDCHIEIASRRWNGA